MESTLLSFSNSLGSDRAVLIARLTKTGLFHTKYLIFSANTRIGSAGTSSLILLAPALPMLSRFAQLAKAVRGLVPRS